MVWTQLTRHGDIWQLDGHIDYSSSVSNMHQAVHISCALTWGSSPSKKDEPECDRHEPVRKEWAVLSRLRLMDKYSWSRAAKGGDRHLTMMKGHERVRGAIRSPTGRMSPAVITLRGMAVGLSRVTHSLVGGNLSWTRTRKSWEVVRLNVLPSIDPPLISYLELRVSTRWPKDKLTCHWC